MIQDVIIHDMSSRQEDRLFAYLDRSGKLKVIVENRTFEELVQFALPSRWAILARAVLVDPETLPNISTDQNANAWVDGVEFKDIMVKDLESLPSNLPPVLTELINKVWEADVAAREE